MSLEIFLSLLLPSMEFAAPEARGAVARGRVRKGNTECPVRLILARATAPDQFHDRPCHDPRGRPIASPNPREGISERIAASVPDSDASRGRVVLGPSRIRRLHNALKPVGYLQNPCRNWLRLLRCQTIDRLWIRFKSF